MDKSIVQRVYEHVRSCGREVTTREVLAAFPDAKASAVTFSLSRLVKSGELKRSAHGRYSSISATDRPSAKTLLEDPYIMAILERVRPVLAFSELVYLYRVLDSARNAVPDEVARLAERRVRNISKTAFNNSEPDD